MKPSNVGSTAAERFEWGRSLREHVPLESHAGLGQSVSRDPIRLITDQEANRLQFLIPVRRERMGVSAFTFYRGSAVVQAADLRASEERRFAPSPREPAARGRPRGAAKRSSNSRSRSPARAGPSRGGLRGAGLHLRLRRPAEARVGYATALAPCGGPQSTRGEPTTMTMRNPVVRADFARLWPRVPTATVPVVAASIWLAARTGSAERLPRIREVPR